MILEIFMASSRDGLKKTEYEILLSAVPEEKRQQILKQKVKHNADNSLIGIALVMAAVSKTFSVPISEIILEYEDGKPYIKNHKNIFVSISHSCDLVVCAVSNRPVGIDAEKIRPCGPSVARKIFHRDETMSGSLYTKEWTILESALKLKGTGISDFRNDKVLSGVETESVLYDSYWITAAYFKEEL